MVKCRLLLEVVVSFSGFLLLRDHILVPIDRLLLLLSDSIGVFLKSWLLLVDEGGGGFLLHYQIGLVDYAGVTLTQMFQLDRKQVFVELA